MNVLTLLVGLSAGAGAVAGSLLMGLVVWPRVDRWLTRRELRRLHQGLRTSHFPG